MSTLLYHIKGLFTVLNFLLFLLLLAGSATWFKKRKISKVLFITAGTLFLICSTAYLPHWLAKKLEQQYQPLNPNVLKGSNGKIYIHLLGSGYGLDRRLPATAQLASVAQGRLLEALRVYRQLDSSVLVCSGSSLSGVETQAYVARNAAILLGVDSSRIITLDTPTTTQEEAASLAARVGSQAAVIIVTDAMHMPRAYKFFSQQGFHPVAAPTNFKVLEVENDLSLKCWPSIGNIGLMDMVIHEWLGNLKAAL